MNYEEQLTRGKNAFRIRDYQRAQKILLPLASEEAPQPEALILLGSIYFYQNEYKKAIQTYLKAIKIDDRNAEAYNNLGIAYRSYGQPDKAKKALLTAGQLMPDRMDIWYNLANLYKQQEKYEQAKKYYERSIKINPDFSMAYNNMGTLFEQVGDDQSAAAWFREGLSRDPNHPTLLYNLALNREKNGFIEEAGTHFAKALRAKPNWQDCLNSYGLVLQKLGQNNEALRVFEKILVERPDDSQAHNNIGLVLTVMGEEDRAEHHFLKAVEGNKNNPHAALNLSKTMEAKGQIAQAIALLEESTSDDNLEAGLQLAQFYLMQKDYKHGAAKLRNILDLYPREYRAHLLFGRILKAQGKKKKALSALQRAHHLQPENIEINMELASLHSDFKQFEKAIGHISFILKNNPQHFLARLLLGEVYLKQHLYQEARQILDILYEENPNDKDLIQYLIRTYQSLGDKAKALRLAEELVQLDNETAVDLDLNDLQKALETYDSLADEYAKDFEELWKKNLSAIDTKPAEDQNHAETDSSDRLLLDDLPDLEGETVPILDLGVIDPIIEVNEETDTLKLMELEEELEDLPEFPEEEEEPEEEHHSTLDGMNDTIDNPPPRPLSTLPQLPPVILPAQPQLVPQPVQTSAANDSSGSGFPGAAAPPPAPPSETPDNILDKLKGLMEQMNQNSVITHKILTDSAREKPVDQPIPQEKKTESTPEKEQEKIEEENPPAEIPEKPAPSEDGEHPIDGEKDNLFAYLSGLTHFLPKNQQSSFKDSDMYLRLKTLDRKMRGEEGLLASIEKNFDLEEQAQNNETINREMSNCDGTDGSISKNRVNSINTDKISSTLNFLGKLSGHHPDPKVGLALNQKIEHILKELPISEKKGVDRDG